MAGNRDLTTIDEWSQVHSADNPAYAGTPGFLASG